MHTHNYILGIHTHLYVCVTCSAKTGLMAYFEAAWRNDALKHLVCWNSPMVEATGTTFYTSFLPSRASTIQESSR